MRLSGIDRRFSRDHLYIILLYQVKEALEIKRSRVTYFRKLKTNRRKYNKATIGNMTKVEIERTNAGFKAYKNVRGTMPYFQGKKGEVFAMIRQLGPPNVFFTKSVNETGMLHLIQALRQKDENRIITEDEVKDMTKAERKKIIKKYPIDVVNHLDALFRHIITGIQKDMSLGQYHVKDYVYWVEFQQRGSAHIHCIFWLGLKNGKPPPQVYMESLEEGDQVERDCWFIDYFNSIICASSTHEDLSKEEIEFQKHCHTNSCYK